MHEQKCIFNIKIENGRSTVECLTAVYNSTDSIQEDSLHTCVMSRHAACLCASGALLEVCETSNEMYACVLIMLTPFSNR